jgi:hypothetical protein
MIAFLVTVYAAGVLTRSGGGLDAVRPHVQ